MENRNFCPGKLYFGRKLSPGKLLWGKLCFEQKILSLFLRHHPAKVVTEEMRKRWSHQLPEVREVREQFNKKKLIKNYLFFFVECEICQVLLGKFLTLGCSACQRREANASRRRTGRRRRREGKWIQVRGLLLNFIGVTLALEDDNSPSSPLPEELIKWRGSFLEFLI